MSILLITYKVSANGLTQYLTSDKLINSLCSQYIIQGIPRLSI